MVEVNIRLIYNPKTNLFELTIRDKIWELTADQTKQFVADARKELADVTDTVTEFKLKVPYHDWTVNMTGIQSREAFEAIVSYLEKVWNSHQLWKNP